VLCGTLFVLYTGIPWEFLPQELGFGSGMIADEPGTDAAARCLDTESILP
jgi:hypothetical protein